MTTNQQHRSDQIAALYGVYAARLIALVSARIRAPRAIIEDACAMAWETLLTRTHVNLQRDTVRTWLVRVATHEALRLARDQQRQRPTIFDDDYDADEPRPGSLAAPIDPSADTANLATERMTNDQRRADLAALKPAQQRALVLHAAGYTYDEIADLTNSTHTAVNRRITEGRAHLRRAAREHVQTTSVEPTSGQTIAQRDLRLAQAGYSADEIAALTSRTVATVNRCLRAARVATRHEPNA